MAESCPYCGSDSSPVGGSSMIVYRCGFAVDVGATRVIRARPAGCYANECLSLKKELAEAKARARRADAFAMVVASAVGREKFQTMIEAAKKKCQEPLDTPAPEGGL